MLLALSDFKIDLNTLEQVRTHQYGTDARAYIETRLWIRGGYGWVPTDLVERVPCGELALTWHRMTLDLEDRIKTAAIRLKRSPPELKKPSEVLKSTDKRS